MELDKILPIVINLDRDEKNWQNMQLRLKHAGFLYQKRWSATDGKTLSDDCVRKYLSVCAYNDLQSNDRRDHQMIYTLGSVGCYLSHASIWQYVVKHKLPYALVLEDDVLLHPCFTTLYSEAIEEIKTAQVSFDVALLGYFFDSRMKSSPSQAARHWKILQPRSQFCGTQSYLISYQGAKNLLKVAFPMETQVDAFISKLPALDFKVIYSTTKLACQDLHLSSVQNNNKTVPFVAFDCPLAISVNDCFTWLRFKHNEWWLS